jgi:hypothetical protein
MKLFRKKQSLALWYFCALPLLSGCGGAELECGSLETRNSVVKIVADNKNNSLVNYAIKNSSTVAEMVAHSASAARSANHAQGEEINDEPTKSDANAEAEKSAIWEKAREDAIYTLDDAVRMNSRNSATRVVTCSGLLYVTVADITAQKEVEFTVEQTADGKIFVSVKPFLF